MVVRHFGMQEKQDVERRTLDKHIIVLLIAIAIGAALRLWDIAGPSLAHPEIYIPGIDLPAGISEPPARHGFLETLSWHFHSEPHPPGYYMAMWAWTKIFGTSELALRLPGALMGILSIWLIWRLAASLFDRKTASLAAILLALSGFHIYWSQMARMYAPADAFALLSTWALAVWMKDSRARPVLEAGYVLSIIAGTQCDELFWAIPFLHIAWTAIIMPIADAPYSWRNGWRPWSVAPHFRMLQIQAIAVALAAPEFIHAALHARGGAAPEPAPHFLLEYMDAGFLFETNLTNMGSIAAPGLSVAVAVAAITITLCVTACFRGAAAIAENRPRTIAFPAMLSMVSAGTIIALLLAAISARHRHALMVVALLPLLCLWLPGVAEINRALLDRWLMRPMQWLRQIPQFTLLMLMLAFVPPVVFYILSIKMSVLAPRAFLPFVPFVVLLIAAGTMRLPGLLRDIISSGCVALFILSAIYFHARPKSPSDYKNLAHNLSHAYRPGDILYVRYSNWADTPFFYYMRNGLFLSDADTGYFRGHRPNRVWLIDWPSTESASAHDWNNPDIKKRILLLKNAGYTPMQSIYARNARATLFAPASLLPGKFSSK